MGAGDGEGVGDPAVRERDTGQGRRGECARDAGDELERDAGRGERDDLLADPSEDARIAALQADDLPAGQGVVDQELDDRLLGKGMAAAPLADVDAPRGRPLEDRLVEEGVVEDDLGGQDRLAAAQGDEVGRAGAGADEGHATEGHRSLHQASRSGR